MERNASQRPISHKEGTRNQTNELNVIFVVDIMT